MSDITSKSAGQLLDEIVTNAFKTTFAALDGRTTVEFDARYELLCRALEQRVGKDFAQVVHDLCIVSLATWQAQEVVMSERDDMVVAEAARQAQRMNARRTALIREIDRVLGESNITITTKTYG